MISGNLSHRQARIYVKKNLCHRLPPEGTGVGACQNELWINPSVFTISEGNYVMKPAEDVDECPRTYDMLEFAGF